MIHRKTILSLGILSSLIFASSASAACVSVSRNLSVGSKGNDVLVLQRFLNSDNSTLIAILGANSPGEETGVFDLATKNAVKALQLKYKAMVLTPAGLALPNGFVGPLTRSVIKQKLCDISGTNKFFITSATGTVAVTNADVLSQQQQLDAITAKANKIIKDSSQRIDDKLATLSANVAELKGKEALIDKSLSDSRAGLSLLDTLTSGDIQALAPATTGNFGENDPLRLLFLSPPSVRRGERLALLGTGFLAKNIVHFGTTIVDSGTPNASGTVLYITIPFNALSGTSTIVVENSKGMSSALLANVVSGGIPAHIDSYYPQPVSLGSRVTLTGDHFAQSNDIVTTYGPIHNALSSDGKTLSFVLSPESLSLFGNIDIKNIPLSIAVSNANGTSNLVTLSVK